MKKTGNKLKLILFPIPLLIAGCDNCDQLVARFKQIIEKDFNYCEIDQDCEVVMGVCPLGCFLIVHHEKMADVKKMVKKIENDCPTCVYKCPVPPQKINCIEKVCYPDIEDKYTAILFYENCGKTPDLYSKYLIGKKIEEIDLHLIDHEVIPSDSTITLHKMKNDRFNNLKLFLDEEGIIESVSCSKK